MRKVKVSEVKNDIFNYIVISLEHTLKDFFKCGSGTEPQVDALLHELQSEVALLQIQETTEQAQKKHTYNKD